MIIKGILIVLLWFLIVLSIRLISTFFHEMGHAIPALLFTNDPVKVYVGSYGDSTGSAKINLGRIVFYFKLDIFGWNIGLCEYKSAQLIFKELIIAISGPLMSLLISAILVFWMIRNDVSNAVATVFGAFILSAIWDFAVNLYPSKTLHKSEYGDYLYSDGARIKQLVQLATYPEDYINTLTLYHKKDYKGAADVLKSVIENGFKKREIYRVLCESLEKSGELAEAAEYFEKYYNDHKFKPEDYANLGSVFLQLGQYDKALNCLDQSLHIDYSNARTINLKGRVFLGKGDYEMAIKEFDAAIYRESKFAEAFRNRGYAKLKNDQIDDGYNDIQSAIQRDKCSAHDYFYLGIYYEKKGQYTQALEQFKLAKKNDVGFHGIDFKIEEIKALLEKDAPISE